MTILYVCALFKKNDYPSGARRHDHGSRSRNLGCTDLSLLLAWRVCYTIKHGNRYVETTSHPLREHMSKPLDFTPLERALQSLQEAQAQPPRNELERDGVIQRFEYTFELCWKSIRKALLFLGRTEVSGSPKPLFCDALEEHLIREIEPWFTYLEARNATSHIYNRDQAEKVFNSIRGFAAHAEVLLKALQRNANDEFQTTTRTNPA